MTKVKINLLNNRLLNINELNNVVDVNIESQDKYIVINVRSLGSNKDKPIFILLDLIIYNRLKQTNKFNNDDKTPLEE